VLLIVDRRNDPITPLLNQVRLCRVVRYPTILYYTGKIDVAPVLLIVDRRNDPITRCADCRIS